MTSRSPWWRSVATKSGWGDGFATFLTPGAECVNWARGGRSSKSFINEGWWKKALAEKPDYVLIQFGHNDQPGKGDRSTDPNSDFRDYLQRYVDDARTHHIQPILVTPVARRTFAEGKVLPVSSLWSEVGMMAWYERLRTELPSLLAPRLIELRGVLLSQSYGRRRGVS